MPRPFLLIVCGLPATGKTTLARRLATDLRLPLLCKDDLKESLFDSLGAGDREWSRRLGAATFRLLAFLTAQMIDTGQSLIVEANLHAEFDTPVYRRLGERAALMQLWLTATREVVAERFAERALGAERHRGHVEREHLAEMRAALLAREDAPLPLGGALHVVDTTDFSRVDYARILQVVSDTRRAAERMA